MNSTDLEVKATNDSLSTYNDLAVRAGKSYHRLLVHRSQLAVALGITVPEITHESVLSDEPCLDLCEELIEEIHTLAAKLKIQNDDTAQRLEVIEAYVDALPTNTKPLILRSRGRHGTECQGSC